MGAATVVLDKAAAQSIWPTTAVRGDGMGMRRWEDGADD